MSKERELTIWVAEMELGAELSVQTPLLAPSLLTINESPDNIVSILIQSLQDRHLDAGSYTEVLRNVLPCEPRHLRVPVEIPAHSEFNFYPALTLQFDAFALPLPAGPVAAWIPALGLACLASEPGKIEESLAQQILTELIRTGRLTSLHALLPTQSCTSPVAKGVTALVEFHSLAELEVIAQRRERKLLPEVADALYVWQPAAFDVGRELGQLADALRGRFVRSVLLVGPPGCGKTAVIQQFAHSSPRERTIWETTASRLEEKLTQQGAWQELLSKLVTEIAAVGDILFVRNLAELFEVGQYEGNDASVADFLREPLQRGDLVLLAECTPEEAARIEARAPGYLSLFQRIDMEPPDGDRLAAIVEKKIGSIGRRLSVTVERPAIEEALRLHKRYLPYSGFPGKVIAFFENMILRMSPGSEQRLSEGLIQTPGHRTKPVSIDRPTVIRHFCSETGLPSSMVDPDEPLDLDGMERFFRESVFGQDEAVQTVLDVLAATKAALNRPGKPIASLLFVGPTGVGKTELAKVMAHFMFGSRNRMVRFDMSEFSDPVSVLRLIGDGSTVDGLLTSSVRAQPFSVVLFDEVEKASQVFNDFLLQVMGEGRLTDARGRLADFSSTVIILTSNIGTESFSRDAPGFSDNRVQAQEVTRHFADAVQNFFRPELFNRLDQIVTFHPLGRNTLRRILDREMKLIGKRHGFCRRNLALEIPAEVLDLLGRLGYDRAYGARQLQRTIRRELLAPLARQMNQHSSNQPLHFDVELLEDKIVTTVDAGRQQAGMAVTSPEEISLEVSQWRRESQRVRDGGPFLEVQNRYELLERKRRLSPDEFTSSPSFADHARLAHFLQEATRYFRGIEEMEVDLYLGLMQGQGVPENCSTRLLAWRKEWANWKLELFGHVETGGDAVAIGIFGGASHLMEMVEFYLAVCHHKSLRPTVGWVVMQGRQPVCVARPPAGAVKVGARLVLEAPKVLAYFAAEGGVHAWGPNDTYYVSVHRPSEWTIPKGVERQGFVRTMPMRRELGRDFLKDENYEIHLSGRNIPAQFADFLDRRFFEQVTQILTTA